MSDPLPPPAFVLLLHFEGAPVHFEMTRDEMRDYLADVLEDAAECYVIWKVWRTGRPGENVTAKFCREWSKAFDVGGGDDRETILAPFPPFIRAFIGDKIVADYRAAQEVA